MRKVIIPFVAILSILIFQSCSQSAGNLSSGKIKLTDYKVMSGKKYANKFVTIYFTPQRIRIQGEGFTSLDAQHPNGLLIRKDKKDIIFFATNNKAIKLTKADVDSLAGLIGGFVSLMKGFSMQDSTSMISFKKTGKTKNIDGFKSQEFVLINSMPSDFMKGLPNSHLEIWMTKGLNIDWGFLADDVAKIGEKFGLKKDSPAISMLQGNYFPLLVKKYSDSTLVNVVKTKVTAANNAKSHVQIPSDVKVMGYKQFVKHAFNNLGTMFNDLGNNLDSLGNSQDSLNANKRINV